MNRKLLAVLVALPAIAILASSCTLALAVRTMQVPAVAPSISATPDVLTLDVLKNAAYRLDLSASGVARLTNGVYMEHIIPGAPVTMVVHLPGPIATGDLNGDGVDDAAVILTADPGDSGVFYYLAAVVNEAGQPRHVASVVLGDRIQVKSLSIAAEQVVVHLAIQGPDDPACCPSREITQKYELRGETLVMVEEK